MVINIILIYSDVYTILPKPQSVKFREVHNIRTIALSRSSSVGAIVAQSLLSCSLNVSCWLASLDNPSVTRTGANVGLDDGIPRQTDAPLISLRIDELSVLSIASIIRQSYW